MKKTTLIKSISILLILTIALTIIGFAYKYINGREETAETTVTEVATIGLQPIEKANIKTEKLWFNDDKKSKNPWKADYLLFESTNTTLLNSLSSKLISSNGGVRRKWSCK